MPIRNATLINSIYFFEDIGINVYIHGICNWISHLASANVQVTNIQLASWPDATNWRLSACNWPGPIKLMISYTVANYWPMMYGNYCPINTVSFHHHDIVSVMSYGLWLYKEGTLAIKPLVDPWSFLLNQCQHCSHLTATDMMELGIHITMTS